MTSADARPTRIGIQRLSPDVVARIAAGEVISHPADVVRELVENAFDANAGLIRIEIRGGGLTEIVVHDDGDGISIDDAALLFTRHATSKGDAHGNLHGIVTLGFRGEGLASIATVACVTVRTQHADEAHGFCCVTQPDADPEVTWIARQRGTSVEVRDLFSTFPVRRRALAPQATQREVRRVVQQLAVSRPDVALRLSVDGRQVLHSPGGDRDALLATLCDEVSRARLVELPRMQGPGWSLDAVLAPPGTTLRGIEGITLSVNGRRTSVEPMLTALQRAWSRLFPRQRLPFAALWLTVDHTRVDVNMHPAKAAVLIEGVDAIAEALSESVSQHLGRATWRARELRPLALDLGRFGRSHAAEQASTYDADADRDDDDEQRWSSVDIPAGQLPALRLVGHLEHTLLICESALGTLLIDQHRAHERVIHERLLAAIDIPLRQPERVGLPPQLVELLSSALDDLQNVGWRIEIDRTSAVISAVPPGMEAGDLLPLLRLHANDLDHGVLAAVACQAALRKHRAIDQATAVELLTALSACRQPATCPHGQPIILHLDRAFLERQFEWR